MLLHLVIEITWPWFVDAACHTFFVSCFFFVLSLGGQGLEKTQAGFCPNLLKTIWESFLVGMCYGLCLLFLTALYTVDTVILNDHIVSNYLWESFETMTLIKTRNWENTRWKCVTVVYF